MATGKPTDRDPPGIPPASPANADAGTPTDPVPWPRLNASMKAESRFFLSSGFSKPDVLRACQAATRNRTSVERELIAAGLLRSDIYYRFLADHLGLDHLETIDPASVMPNDRIDATLSAEGFLAIVRGDRIVTVLVPEARRLADHERALATHPDLRERLVVAAPETVRAAVWASRSRARVVSAARHLNETRPAASARQVLTAPQAYMLASVKAVVLGSLILAPAATLLVAHVVLSGFFFASNLTRLLAGFSGGRPRRPQLPQVLPADLPVYTILVALRDEAEIVPQLVRALNRLAWPKSLLDIKFICEEADRETISALTVAGLGPHCEIVRVPDHAPMTKPKALQYAMAGARGSLIAVYDAEDVPNPAQLLEAWSLFEAGDDGLACVQAPLAIANYTSGWLTALFAIEYCGLFRALVPFLGRLGLPIPLGGTSNHFRRGALEAVGGWDPHNVTEDADLGFRLYRAGYRTKAAYHATIETAPDMIDIWLKQRSRWLKGWLQTWLVTMRQPIMAAGEFGWKGFATFQFLIAGMLVSVLAYPAMLAVVCLYPVGLALGVDPFPDGAHRVLWCLDVFNIAASFLAFLLPGWRNMTRLERREIPRRWMAMLPVYWLIMSMAGWRALRQLVKRPHHWDKTPHKVEPASAR